MRKPKNIEDRIAKLEEATCYIPWLRDSLSVEEQESVYPYRHIPALQDAVVTLVDGLRLVSGALPACPVCKAEGRHTKSCGLDKKLGRIRKAAEGPIEHRKFRAEHREWERENITPGSAALRKVRDKRWSLEEEARQLRRRWRQLAQSLRKARKAEEAEDTKRAKAQESKRRKHLKVVSSA